MKLPSERPATADKNSPDKTAQTSIDTTLARSLDIHVHAGAAFASVSVALERREDRQLYLRRRPLPVGTPVLWGVVDPKNVVAYLRDAVAERRLPWVVGIVPSSPGDTASSSTKQQQGGGTKRRRKEQSDGDSLDEPDTKRPRREQATAALSPSSTASASPGASPSARRSTIVRVCLEVAVGGGGRTGTRSASQRVSSSLMLPPSGAELGTMQIKLGEAHIPAAPFPGPDALPVSPSTATFSPAAAKQSHASVPAGEKAVAVKEQPARPMSTSRIVLERPSAMFEHGGGGATAADVRLCRGLLQHALMAQLAVL